MKILGIDYGKANIGLSRGDTQTMLAVPMKVVRVNSMEDALEKVGFILKDFSFDRVVVGLSEGEMGRETKIFGKNLKNRFEIEVDFQDETLTSKDAQNLAIQAGIKRHKRKEMEHAYSASLILQDYLENLK